MNRIFVFGAQRWQRFDIFVFDEHRWQSIDNFVFGALLLLLSSYPYT